MSTSQQNSKWYNVCVKGETNTKRTQAIVLILLFIGFIGVGINDLRNNHIKLELKEIKLQDKALELNQLKLQKEQLNKKFDAAANESKVNEEKVRQLEAEKLDLEKKTRQLEVELQAKRAQKSTIASLTPQASAAVPVSGTKADWLRASGIPESDWWAVDSIVSRESSWNPNARGQLVWVVHNGVSIQDRACGLAQSLPCSKVGANWSDPVVSLKWQYEYVKARYGGYPQAVAFWNQNHWY